jgi:hypothetical protein
MSNKTRREFLQNAGKLIAGVAAIPVLINQTSTSAVTLINDPSPKIELGTPSLDPEKAFYKYYSIFNIPIVENTLDSYTHSGLGEEHIQLGLREMAAYMRKEFKIPVENKNVYTTCIRYREYRNKDIRLESEVHAAFVMYFNDNYMSHYDDVYRYLKHYYDSPAKRWFYPTQMSLYTKPSDTKAIPNDYILYLEKDDHTLIAGLRSTKHYYNPETKGDDHVQ